MSRAKQTATLSGMIDGDMEEDTLAGNAFPSPDSNQENTGPPARKVGRTKTKPAAKRFTKPPSRRTSRSSTTAQKQKVTKTKAGGKRAPLLDQTNRQYEGDTEEVDDLPLQATQEGLVAEEAEIRPKGKRKAPPKESDKLPRKAASRQIGAKEKDGEFEYTPTTARTKNVSQSNGPGRQTSAQPRQGNRGVQASQSGADIEPLEPSPVLPRYHEPSCRGFGGARSESQPRRQNPIKRYRAGSASDTERAGDPAIRRKLGDVTRKFETLDLKYRNLREIGIKEADANFEKLRVQSEARAKAANDVINSLRRDLATQKSLASDASSAQKQISSRDAELAKTRALVDQLSTSLSEVQNENKSLQAKLANSRIASASVESMATKTPSSAVKARQQQQEGRTVIVGSAEAAQAAQVAQLKEDLFSDLTGLIIRGVDVGTESDVYDCLQTGRNGTLHFKLAITKNSDESYDETEFQYTPRLDDDRDQDLIAVMPEYLTEEILFSRTNAARFYGRVLDTLTAKKTPPTTSRGEEG